MLAPFALWPVLPTAVAGRYARDYYEASAPPHGRQSATDLPLAELAVRRAGRPRTVPTFTMRSVGQGGAQLYSGSIATTTPQTFVMASSPTELDGFGVVVPDLTAADHVHCRPARIRQVWERRDKPAWRRRWKRSTPKG